MVCPRRGGENTFFLIHEGPRRARRTFARSLFGLFTKSRGEHLSWSTQIMVVEHENQARNGPILPAGVLFCHIVSSFLQMSTEPGKHPGQTHLNSDAKIADEGHPQGGEGTHKGCPYLLFSAKKPASSRQRRLEFAIAHCDLHSSRRYALGRAPTRGGGHPQGVPLPSFFGQETGLQSPKTFGICDSALRSAQFSALCLGEGTHKGRPYQLFSLGVMP